MLEQVQDHLTQESLNRPRRSRPRVLHHADVTRLVSMLGLLLVLWVLILRAKDPATWAWLVEEPAPAGFVSAAPAVAGIDATPGSGDTPSSAASEESRPDPPITDEDSEQREAAREEFQAITDRTTELQPEEMPAYWRVMTWVTQQRPVTLKSRARADFVFNDLIQEPEVNRGRLLRLSLNVRRVLSYEVPQNPLGIQRLYEVWGFTNESKAWLYVGVTPELPAGMPLGPEIAEEAEFYGYFFKVQGYLEAAAGPRVAPLGAPLLVGRLEWRPAAQPVGRTSQELPWMIGLAVLAGLFVVGRGLLAVFQLRRRSPRQRRVRDTTAVPTFDWMAPDRDPAADASEISETTGELRQPVQSDSSVVVAGTSGEEGQP